MESTEEGFSARFWLFCVVVLFSRCFLDVLILGRSSRLELDALFVLQPISQFVQSHYLSPRHEYKLAVRQAGEEKLAATAFSHEVL